jgi:hypothetical protein
MTVEIKLKPGWLTRDVNQAAERAKILGSERPREREENPQNGSLEAASRTKSECC